MKERRRGEDTKDRILEEACKLFAERGYRDATHSEICSRAGSNVASINYYFGSKENLYRAVFDHLRQKVERICPLHGNLPPTATPEKRLEAFIHGHLSRIYNPELMGDLHRIRMAEMFDSTGLLEDQLQGQLAKDREQVQSILRELLGAEASQRNIEWCEMSIVGQCFLGAPGPSDKGPRALFGLHAGEVEHLTDHILRFSLAGIKAIRRKAQSDGERKESGRKS